MLEFVFALFISAVLLVIPLLNVHIVCYYFRLFIEYNFVFVFMVYACMIIAGVVGRLGREWLRRQGRLW